MAVRRPPFVEDAVPVHGQRAKTSYIVLHTTEGGGTVESLARYFRGTADGLGSSFLVEENGRLGIYVRNLADRTYHVKSHNSEMIGIEQVGHASMTRTEWLTKRRRQLFATAWTVAWLSDQLGIPVRNAVDHGRTLARTGVLQHSQVPDNDHNDCGSGYPIDFVMKYAKKWANGNGPSLGTRGYIRTGVRLLP